MPTQTQTHTHARARTHTLCTLHMRMNVAMLTCESDRSKACEAAVAKARAMTSTASRAACDVAASIDSPGPSLLLASTHSPVASVGTRNGVSRATIATRWGRAAPDGDDIAAGASSGTRTTLASVARSTFYGIKRPAKTRTVQVNVSTSCSAVYRCSIWAHFGSVTRCVWQQVGQLRRKKINTESA